MGLIVIYFLAAFAGLMAAIGDGCLKIWIDQGHKFDASGLYQLAGGVIFWNISLAIFVRMMLYGSFAQSVMLFIVSNYVFALLISQFWFGETLSTVQWGGIVLALLAIVLMELG